MKKNKMKQLVAALRSGEYKQGKEVLVNNNDEFCCLGVACNISKQDLEWKGEYNTWEIGGQDKFLPTAIQEEFGFYSSVGRRKDDGSLHINRKEYNHLAAANDDGCTFKQIADYIEINYKQL